MPVFRVEKNKNYTTMSNFHLKEKNMSLKAKGLLSLMLSLPDDWDYSVDGLTHLCVEGKSGISAALKELEQFHYLSRSKIRDKNGKICDWEYRIFEQPLADFPVVAKPDMAEPVVVEPVVANDTQQNTNINNSYNKQNTEETMTNNIKEIIKEVVDYLNYKLGTNYKYTTKEILKHINARVHEGFTVYDFKVVIDKKYDDWKGTEWEKYLRPETLFGNKFEGYLNQTNAKTSFRRTTKEQAEDKFREILARRNAQ